MKLQELQDGISNNLFQSDQKINISKTSRNGSGLKTNNYEVYKEILSTTTFLDEEYNKISITQRLWHIMNNIFTVQKCESCNNNLNFINYKRGYTKYCSKPCARKNSTNQRKQTNLEKYGVEHPMQLSEIVNKIKETKENLYGDPNYNNMEKTRKTKEEKYGNSNYNNIDQRKQTNLEIYGVEYPMQTEEVKRKQRESLVENHGVEYPAQSNEIMEKIKETKLERYGDPYFTNRERSKQTNLKRYGDPYYNNPEKARQTNLERYGVEFPLQLNEVIEKIQ